MKTNEKSVSKYVLYIDTSSDQSKIALFEDNAILAEEVWVGHSDLSETLLTKIEQLLKKSGLKLFNLNNIAIFPGPGSYTGLRIGITTANFLSWSLQISIMPARIESGKLIKTRANEKYVLPKYLKPAHITKPRSRVI